MQDRRVIYDSEEEDEAFSPLNSPAKGDASHGLKTAEDNNEGQKSGDQIGDSRSTDPDLFRRIYEEQQKGITDSVSASVRDTQAHNGSSDKLKSSDSKEKAKSDSSSITDPSLKSGKKRGLRKLDAKDFGYLTQVTTPSATSAKQKDVYDFSLSDEEGTPARPANFHKDLSPKGARAASKRKRGHSPDRDSANATAKLPQLSNLEQYAQDEVDESPRPTGKRRRSAQDQRMRQVPDDVDLLVIPTSTNISDQPNETTSLDADGFNSVVPDARVTQTTGHGYRNPPASFFIDPPDNLTLSQKNEYLRVSDHSEVDGEDIQQQASLPVPKPAQTEGQRSTCTSVSTIAYTTPSRFASSLDPLPILDTSDARSSNAATSSDRKTQVDRIHPLSSPDELNAPLTVRKSRDRRHMSIVNEEEELVQQDSWDSDKIGYSRDSHAPYPGRRATEPGQDRVTDKQAEDETKSVTKKRQKKDEIFTTAHEDSWDSDNIRLPRERHAPRPSRRYSGVWVDEDEEMQHAEEYMPDTCPPGDASYKRTAEIESAAVSLNQKEPDQSTEAMAGVDPDVWAALPDDIRQELISQQVSARTSQASRTRRSGRASEAASSSALIQDEKPQPKKRGRKKKVQTIEEEPLPSHEPAAAFHEPEARPSPAPNATAKRKRGRPRKSEAAPPPSSFEKEELGAAMQAPDLSHAADAELGATHALLDESPKTNKVSKAPPKRGRKRKVIETPPVLSDELDENAHLGKDSDEADGSAGKRVVEPPHSPVDPLTGSLEVEDRQALRDISSTASNLPAQDGSALDPAAEKTSTEETQKQQEVTPEPNTKSMPKSASTPGQQGKVPLRVGLSKRSRIAPLLKVIRK